MIQASISPSPLGRLWKTLTSLRLTLVFLIILAVVLAGGGGLRRSPVYLPRGKLFAPRAALLPELGTAFFGPGQVNPAILLKMPGA